MPFTRTSRKANTKITYQLPKIQVGNQEESTLPLPQSLSPSPSSDVKRKTFNENPSMASFYNSHNSSKALAAESKKTLKQSQGSTHIIRFLDSSNKKKRKQSIFCLQNTPSEHLIIQSFSEIVNQKQKSISQIEIPKLIVKSPSMTSIASDQQQQDLSPVNLSYLNSSSSQAQIESPHQKTLFFRKEKEDEYVGSPKMKFIPPKQNINSLNCLQLPSIEGTLQNLKIFKEESLRQSFSRNCASRGEQLKSTIIQEKIKNSPREQFRNKASNEKIETSASREKIQNQENKVKKTIEVNRSQNFASKNQLKRIIGQKPFAADDELKKLRQQNEQLLKDILELKKNQQVALDKKNREVEQLQIDNQNLKFQLQVFQNEKQKLLRQQQKKDNILKYEKGIDKRQPEIKKALKEIEAYQKVQYNELIMQLELGYQQILKYEKEHFTEVGAEGVRTQFEQISLFIREIQKKQSEQNQLNQYAIGAKLRYFPSNLIKFEHSQKLGKGGFGTVFRVKIGEEWMAQKVFEYDLEKEFTNLEERFEMMFSEVKMLVLVSLLNNDKLVNVHGISFEVKNNAMSGRQQFIFAIFMELIGQIERDKFISTDLKQYISTHFKDEDYEKKMVNIGVQVAEAIEKLYNNHIVHSDLKPQNILIDKNQNIKIIDFGTSKQNFEEKTHDTQLLGYTPRYCPIEHFDMEKLTPTTDVWSFGCLLFEMATAQEPWKGFRKTFDVRKALEEKQSMWVHYTSLLGITPSSVHPEIIKLIEECTVYENRPHPSEVYRRIKEIQEQLKLNELKNNVKQIPTISIQNEIQK